MADALDGYAVAPYDEAEFDRLSDMGIDDPEDDPTVLAEGRSLGLGDALEPQARSTGRLCYLGAGAAGIGRHARIACE